MQVIVYVLTYQNTTLNDVTQMMLKIRDSLQRLHSSAVFQSTTELCSSNVRELVELNTESK